MAEKLYDLAVKVGSYVNRDGETKNRYQNVGAVLANNDGGKFIMLAKWFNPAGVVDERGGESIILSMFKPNDREAVPETTGAAAPAPTPMKRAPMKEDDIPF